ncbi:dihydroxyacetone kinase subunit L [Companilactobacillus crustorum]|uniref:phosphoenolpyruvate--glycerone phosphotransferase n=3 Tax=Companilactobacillus TaxID=2767879 RepID=A0A837RLX6_9LACO|nr:dihydroxyacetone kinase subunit DhaL [Companilactobacillus crustorum]HCD07819.1 dihydroxyacetone kinase subunit L [Lactobacillus sp.]APU71046.1 PTS-dependent dihydroxyacetone kinase, ADP-binding subunit DhaL [Companilactobacillus crustorum]KRK44274.1 dihydroxyacetone kinase, L subunit [Companilactobacillus crustorum JCM 15951]KRO21707.1 dihydroxyacetone kinase, L subunit [Companilactobacillus crustorum]WDT66219.1 dihydroxyacetone kinase subunit DhaL [Companilactobacillus crustorum]
MKLELTDAKKWINLFVEKLEANKSELNELDTAIGDGDHGTNMDRGAQAVTEALGKKEPENLTDLYKTTAFAMIQKVGGASGPLYGTAFLDMSKAVKEDNLELSDLIQIGTDGIKRRGQSDVGMKTMIDIWQPVTEALKANKLNQQVIDAALNNVKELVATKGRASYLEEKSKGHIDPGAQSSAYLFESLIEVIGE